MHIGQLNNQVKTIDCLAAVLLSFSRRRDRAPAHKLVVIKTLRQHTKVEVDESFALKFLP